jgi:CRP-like cAMP-binding protein
LLLANTKELLLDFGRVPEIETEGEALLLELIDECVAAGVAVDGVDLEDASVCVSLDAGDLDVLRAVTRERSFGRGEALARPGDPTTSAWIVLGGVVTIAAPDGPANGPGRRLRSVGPGSIVGEMALISGAPRSAWITAETPVRVRELDPVSLDEFTTLRPAGAAMLYRNLCGVVGGWLRDSSPIPSRRPPPGR